MKSHLIFQRWRWMCLAVAIILMSATVYAGPPTTQLQVGATNVANPKPLRSAFVIPTTSRDGKDPFFPRSVRVYNTGVIKAGNTNPPVAELSINGFSGTAEKPYVIINNSTFAVGDEQDVLSKGRRFRVRCIEINTAEGRARVQIGSDLRELRFQTDR